MKIPSIKRRKTIAEAIIRSLIAVCLSIACSVALQSSEKPEPPKVVNVHFAMLYGEVLINYDLLADPGSTYSVLVELRNANDPAYRYYPRTITGDVGTGKFAGMNRKILWPIHQEFPLGLPDSSYYFVINAQKMEESNKENTYLLIGAGAALLTAATTYFLASGVRPKAGQASALPAPPGRP